MTGSVPLEPLVARLDVVLMAVGELAQSPLDNASEGIGGAFHVGRVVRGEPHEVRGGGRRGEILSQLRQVEQVCRDAGGVVVDVAEGKERQSVGGSAVTAPTLHVAGPCLARRLDVVGQVGLVEAVRGAVVVEAEV